jgi:hypothetical protein
VISLLGPLGAARSAHQAIWRTAMAQIREMALIAAIVAMTPLGLTATLDLIVPGHRSVPGQTAVQNVSVDDMGHVGMLLSRRVVDRIVDALPAHEQTTA